MDTKTYLGQLKNIDRRIKDKIEEAEKWKYIAVGTSSGMESDKVQTSPRYDKMGDAVSLAVDYEKESRELARRLTLLKHKVIEQIDQMESELFYNILKEYYIKNMSLAQISVELGYSYRQTTRFYREALISFEKMHGNEYLKSKTEFVLS